MSAWADQCTGRHSSTPLTLTRPVEHRIHTHTLTGLPSLMNTVYRNSRHYTIIALKWPALVRKRCGLSINLRPISCARARLLGGCVCVHFPTSTLCPPSFVRPYPNIITRQHVCDIIGVGKQGGLCAGHGTGPARAVPRIKSAIQGRSIVFVSPCHVKTGAAPVY